MEKNSLSAIPTEKEIDQMKLGKITRLLREEFDMTEDETEDLEKDEASSELKKRIRDILAIAPTRRLLGQAAENLREILEQHNLKRHLLAKLCINIATNLSLDKSIEDKLKIQFDCEVKEFLKYVQSDLDRKECHILVAGETSSGKSTFLNRLLGENILPVSHLSSTSTICELKYGETRQAVVHLRQPNDQGERQITIPLDGTEERQAELKSYMHLEGASRDKQSPVQWIEIFLPLSLLKGGIVLVDSPGVGESEKMDRFVADYIPKCFAFLYIIDSSRAGGVQQDRVGQLLKHYIGKKDAKDFNPESAMFICNKWDLVPSDERDTVKTETFRKLSEMWPGLKDSQVFYVSTKKAVGAFRILSEDFTKVQDGLDLLLPKSLDIKLDTQYRLLTRLLSAALTHIDVQLNVARQNLDQAGKAQKYREAKKDLKSIKDQEEKGLEELGSIMRDKIISIKDLLSDLVKTGKLKKDMTAQKRSMEIQRAILVEQAKKSTSENFSRLKDLYEVLADTLAQCPPFEKLITSTKTAVKSKLKEVAKALRRTQQQALASITGSSYPVPHMDVLDILLQRTVLDTFFRASTMSALNLQLEADSSTYTALQDCWERAPAGTPLIDILMQAMSSEEILMELAERLMIPQHDLMDQLKTDVRKMESIMELTIDETFKDTRSKEEVVNTHELQTKEIICFLGQLAMFHLTKMSDYEYDLDSIEGWTDTGNRPGGESFGEVFRVQVLWKGEETPAALKLPCDIVTQDTALDFLKEEDNVGKLKGDHIVEYYGTACNRVKTEGKPDKLRLGLVMELCDGTLEDSIIGKRDHNPAWWGSNPEKQAAAFSYTQNLAVQLCEGLKTIHDAGFVHRDLKLSNVLVTNTKDNIVKLDVGRIKRQEDITGKVASTTLYTAPEVKEQMHNKSADIYSLGFILWEMWYGLTLYGLEGSAYVSEMKKYLKEGKDIKMPKWKDKVPPIPEWTSLIQDCLKKDPRERPDIQGCLDRISAMGIN